MSPQRIQRKRVKGWRMPEGAVYVGRPTKWGNPFQVIREGGFWTVVDNNGVDYREPTTGWADKDYAVSKAVSLFAMDVELGLAPYPIDEIRGKDLACFCPLDQPCHADVLLYHANPAGGSRHA